MKQLAITPPPVTAPAVPALNIPTSSAHFGPVQIAMDVLGWLIWAAGIIAVGFLIYGGILFVLSGGDAEKATKARNTILYAVVGVIVVTASYILMLWANGFVK